MDQLIELKGLILNFVAIVRSYPVPLVLFLIFFKHSKVLSVTFRTTFQLLHMAARPCWSGTRLHRCLYPRISPSLSAHPHRPAQNSQAGPPTRPASSHLSASWFPRWSWDDMNQDPMSSLLKTQSSGSHLRCIASGCWVSRAGLYFEQIQPKM